MDHTNGFLEIVNKAKQRVSEIDQEELEHFLKAHQPSYLIDVREDHERAEGYIPDSIHLSKGIIDRDIEQTIPNKEAHIVLYCRSGFRSLVAGNTIMEMGYKNVVSLAGGYRDWLSRQSK